MQVTAEQICQLVDGELKGNPGAVVRSPAKIEDAKEGDISFLANMKYESWLYKSNASVILVPRNFQAKHEYKPTLIKVKDVYAAIAILLEKFSPSDEKGIISPFSSIHDSAKIGNNVSIDAFTVISANAEIGEGSIISSHVHVGNHVVIGKNCKIHSGVKILKDCIIGNRCILHANAVIGSDGFGYARKEDGAYQKIPQVGNVILEDDVEIGANTTIDRAVMGSTVIHKGVKLDNLIQIGHNVEINEHTAIAAQAGIAGSTVVGAYCQIGGQAGIVGHIEIPDGTMIQAQSGVISAVKKKKAKLFGSPAIDYNNYLKSYAVFKNLPNLLTEIRQLRQKLIILEEEVEKYKDK